MTDPHIVHEDHIVHDTAHERHRDPDWLVRILLGVGGLLLLATALAAWQMQARFGGWMAMALPWLVAGGVVLGVAAVLESITTEIWVTILAGVFLLCAAFLVSGRVTVQIDAAAHNAYVVDRFTGEVRICNAAGCRDLPGFGTTSVPLPSADDVRDKFAPKR
jgi:hypothetical protein